MGKHQSPPTRSRLEEIGGTFVQGFSALCKGAHQGRWLLGGKMICGADKNRTLVSYMALEARDIL